MKRARVGVVVAAATVFTVLSLHARSAATDVPVTHEGHMEMSASRSPRSGDRERGEAILAAGRALLARYANVADAERDGYKKFLPRVPLPEEHYTNGRNAIAAESAFDPYRPTSIMYRRTAHGLVAEGVMYTAPNSSDADQLDARVPLSLGTWHRHVNFCWSLAARDPRFGFAGSITTQAACDAAGGHFLPVVFDWMLHVWPLQSDPAKIWAVDAEGEHGMMHMSGTVFNQRSLPIAIGRLPSVDVAGGHATRGAAIFIGNCASCHGSGGANGPDAPRLAGSGLKAGQVAYMVRYPRAVDASSAMPELGLSDTDIADVAAYVASIAQPR